MKVTDTELAGVKIIEPKVYEDNRGFFFESFNQKKFEDLIESQVKFVQDNHSRSTKNVLRGLHCQLPPHAQGKLVRVVHGEIFDVAVDIRKSSSTFGNWIGEVLSADNKKQLWIPEGFAHGFLTKSEHAEIIYKTTDYYSPSDELTICWNDPELNIVWQHTELPNLSKKDQDGMSLREYYEKTS